MGSKNHASASYVEKNLMKNLKPTIVIVSVLTLVGNDNRITLECAAEDGEIFSLNTYGQRSNAKEACTSVQIRMFETATNGFADETELNDEYGC